MSLLTKIQTGIVSGNIPSLVQDVMSYALEDGASDIHIEPEKKFTVIRYRIDGVLRSIAQIPMALQPALVSRIKIMGNLKIDEQRLPQDGKTNIVTENGRSMDLRINTLPTIHGEKIVIRLQDKSKVIPTFEQLGIRGSALVNLNDGIAKPNGIVLVTGPTGSGKTTTLYSALNKIRDESVNIMTLEDPVEYEMPGLAQSQMHSAIGYSFAEGLRSALRQDPDIIMLGEIRDQETVEIAIRASLTGHLVLSTIHTNSAIATISRVLDMGIKPYLFAAAITTIQAQRLVRKVCDNCIEQYQPSKKVVDDLLHHVRKLPPTEGLDVSSLHDIHLVRGKGCDSCSGSGYKGRMGIYEVLEVNKELGKLIGSGATEEEIETLAVKQGFVSILQDGLLKALAGITSIEEVFDVANVGE
ncbi:type II/IV secretion system protein [Candidatus Peregrinibacteria bacterium]|jgi:type IV pilus assembly protein PilB|nr:type II/IV secretion system protein [Candidatus Peregrinibacteria bacterium]